MASRLSKQCTISHICAVGLRDTDIIGKHSPLVKFQLGKQEVKTSVAPKAGTEVAWDSVLVLPSEADVDELVIMVYNHHLLRPDNLVGRATLPLSQLESGHGSTKVTLLDKAGKPAGELSFRVQHAGSGHLHTTSAHPEAVADPAAAYKVDEGSHRNHPPPSSQAGSAGYTGSGATDINAPHHGGGIVHDPHGYGVSTVEAPIVGSSAAGQSKEAGAPNAAGSAGYTGSGATDINAPHHGGGIVHDPHGYGVSKVEAPIIGSAAAGQSREAGAPNAAGSAGYTGSGATDITTPHHGGGIVHDPHGYGVSKVEAPIIGSAAAATGGGAAAGAAGYTGAADTGAPHHGGGMIHDPEGYGLSKEEQGAKQGHVNHPEAVTGTAGYTRGGATLINPPPMHERRRPSPHGYGAEKVDDPIVGGDATTEGAKGSKFETAKLEAVGKTAGAVDAVEDKLQQKKNVLLEHREEVPLGEQPTFTERVREATFNTMSVIQDTAEQAKQMFLGKHAPDPAPTAAVGGDTQAAPTTRPEL